jgi:shikimate dehydrogenase
VKVDFRTASEMRRCAVLGKPIAHSLSPALHRAAYNHLDLNWTFDRVEVDERELASFVGALDASWRGLSLTMPLKVAVLELGEVDHLARLAGAGNTLLLEGGERWVYNTDIGGLTWAVGQVTATPMARVTILGAGATARSALIAATQLGAEQVTVAARTPSRTELLTALSSQLGVRLEIRPWSGQIPPADLVVSAVVAGAADGIARTVADSAPLIVDIIYDPWPTVLATTAQRAGCTVISGHDLLVGQALLQIKLMTGRAVAADVLYRALAAELESRPAGCRRVPDF